jgi:hypothetical protein
MPWGAQDSVFRTAFSGSLLRSFLDQQSNIGCLSFPHPLPCQACERFEPNRAPQVCYLLFCTPLLDSSALHTWMHS